MPGEGFQGRFCVSGVLGVSLPFGFSYRSVWCNSEMVGLGTSGGSVGLMRKKVSLFLGSGQSSTMDAPRGSKKWRAANLEQKMLNFWNYRWVLERCDWNGGVCISLPAP